MNDVLLSEKEFTKKVVEWLLKYDIGFLRAPDYTIDDYVHEYTLPDFDYVHVDSFVDEDGDLLTYLKAEMLLKASESRTFKEQRLVFYHILKTFIDSPEVEPYPMGYYIVGYYQSRF